MIIKPMNATAAIDVIFTDDMVWPEGMSEWNSANIGSEYISISINPNPDEDQPEYTWKIVPHDAKLFTIQVTFKDRENLSDGLSLNVAVDMWPELRSKKQKRFKKAPPKLYMEQLPEFERKKLNREERIIELADGEKGANMLLFLVEALLSLGVS